MRRFGVSLQAHTNQGAKLTGNLFMSYPFNYALALMFRRPVGRYNHNLLQMKGVIWMSKRNNGMSTFH